MSNIPRGSVVWSGYGDFNLRFSSVVGALFARPSPVAYLGQSNQQDSCSGLRALPGTLGYVSGAPEPGNTTGAAFMDTALVFRLAPANSTWSLGNAGLTSDAAGNAYGAGAIGSGPAHWKIIKTDPTTGAVLDSWTLTFTLSDNFSSIGVHPDGSKIYFSPADTSGKVYVLDTTTDVVTLFKDLGLAPDSRYIFSNCIYVFANGDVFIGWGGNHAGQAGLAVPTLYSSAGAQIRQYTLPNYYGGLLSVVPSVDTSVSPAVDDESHLVMNYYNNDADNYGVALVKLTVADGTIVSYVSMPTITEAAKDGSVEDFEWDGPMCLTRVDIPLPTIPVEISPVPVATPNAPQTPCDPATQVGNGGIGASGCNTGGVGWETDYPSGPTTDIASHPDPVDGESLKDKVAIDAWIELIHTDYPSDVKTTYRRAMVELADVPAYEGGRKTEGLKTIGDAEHGLGNEQGGWEAGTIDVHYADQTDRIFRELLEDQDLENDELIIKAATPATRRAGGAPKVILRGVVQQPKLESQMNASITAVDSLFAEFGPLGPNRQWPSTTFGDLVEFANAPDDTKKQVIPSLYGEVSDKNARDPITNTYLSKGLIPGYYGGKRDLTGFLPPTPPSTGVTLAAAVATLQASVTAGTCVADFTSWFGAGDCGVLQGMGTVPSDYFGLGNIVGFTDLDYYMANGGSTAAPPDSEWGFIAYGLGEWFRYIQVFGSNLGNGDPTVTPDRVLLDIDTRGDILVPGHIWPFATNYVACTKADGTVVWVTGIYARGPLLQDHLDGKVNITVNAIGRMGNDQLPNMYAHGIQQAWLEDDILGSWLSGDRADAVTYPMWEDGTAKVNSTTLRVRQQYTDDALGGGGLKLGWYVNKAQSLSAWNQEWNRSTESRLGENGHGQIVVWGFDPVQDISTWPRIDHVPEIFGPVRRLVGQERENVVVGTCGWDWDKEKFRNAPQTFGPTAAALAKYKGHIKQGEPVDSMMLNDPVQHAWVLQQRLARLQFGMSLVEFTGRIGLLDHDVSFIGGGSTYGIRLTSIEGTGAAGYVDRPLTIMRRRFSLTNRLVTLTCLDVGSSAPSPTGPTIIDTSDAFLITSVDADAPLITTDPDLAPVIMT